MTTTQSLLRCTKELNTENGLTFDKGGFYSFVITSKGVKVYTSSNQSILIKNEVTLNKNFK